MSEPIETAQAIAPSPSLHHLARYLLWLLPVAFLILFFFHPLGGVFQKAVLFSSGGIPHGIWARVWGPLSFTVWQATLSTILTLAVGLPAAYLFARFTFPGKEVLRILTSLPFILPTVVVAAAFNTLIGPRGWVNVLIMNVFNLTDPPLNLLNTLSAILLAHVFYNTTIVIRLVGGAWAQLDPRLEQAGRILGAGWLRNGWEVTFPLLRPSILAAVLLVFLFDFTSYGVILLLGGPRFATLEVEIYIQTLQMLNLPLAGVLSAIQLACTFLVSLLYSRLGVGQSFALSPRLKGEGVRPARTWREKTFVFVAAVFLLVYFVTPLFSLGLRSLVRLDAERAESGSVRYGLTLAYYRQLFINPQSSIFYVPPVAAARNSMQYALVTVGISLFLGYQLVYAMRRQNRIDRWLNSVLMLPLGTSAVTLGLGYLLVFSRPPLDVRSMPMLVSVAHSLVALPFVIRTLQPVLASIPENLRQAAAVLGASPWQVWRLIDLPILARATLTSAVFAFTISLGEFGATSFLARPEFPTLPVAIFRLLSQPGAMNYGQALAMATLLVLVCAVNLLIIEKINP